MSFAPFDTSLIVERLVTQLPALHFVGGAADYAANSVWGLPGLAGIPIRIDCGDSDPFYSATKQFIAQLPNGAAGGFSPGGHDGSYWSSQLPAELTWIAPLLTA